MLKLLLVIIIALGVVPVVALIRKDYKRFLALGPGGTPQTFRGYLRVKCLSLFALRDPYEPTVPIPDELRTKHGQLAHLPQRKHDRPKTEGIAPHRQTTQQAGKEMFSKLAAAIEAFAPGANNDLTIGTSCFEKHGTGLFSTCPANQTCKGEVVHVHPSDGSMHLTLHPADANIVLQTGWGERHPLAGVFWRKFLPEGFIMLYAPQTDKEIEIVLRVIRAACWFVSEGGSARNGREEKGDAAGGLNRQVEDPGRVLNKI